MTRARIGPYLIAMRFHPDIDQRALIADAFSRPLDDLLPLARLHRADEAEPHAALAELGLFGVSADPEIGGVGLTIVEEALLAAELGRRLAGPRILATMMAAQIADDATRGALIAGTAVAAPALLGGGAPVVIDGDGADWLLVRRDGAAALVPAVATAAPIDGGHWTAALAPAGTLAEPNGWADGPALLRVRLIEAAALCGMAATARDMAVDYAGLREQFGRPIGAFQAIKHHCANMAVAAMAATDQMSFAAVALDEDRADAAFQVEAALLLAIDAALGNARLNVQIHGGMGFSEEADPHLVVKRAHLLVAAAGGREQAAERIARADAPMHRAA